MDDFARISQEQQAKIKEWFANKWPSPQKCFVCSTEEWIIGNHFLKDEAAVPFPDSAEGIYVPYVVVFCRNCGHAVRFNAIMMGVFPQDARPSAPAQQEPRTNVG